MKKKLAVELEKYKSCDPERMKELRKCFVTSIVTIEMSTLMIWNML